MSNFKFLKEMDSTSAIVLVLLVLIQAIILTICRVSFLQTILSDLGYIYGFWEVLGMSFIFRVLLGLTHQADNYDTIGDLVGQIIANWLMLGIAYGLYSLVFV